MKQWTTKEKQNWLALLHSTDEKNWAVALNMLTQTDEVLEELVLAANLKLLMLGTLEDFEIAFEDTLNGFYAFVATYAKKKGWKDINESVILLLRPQFKHFPILATYSSYSKIELFEVYEPYHLYICKLLLLHDFYKELLLAAAISYNLSHSNHPQIHSRDITPRRLHLLFDGILTSEPKNARAMFHLALFYQNVPKDFDTSIRLFKAFVAAYPKLKIRPQKGSWRNQYKRPSTVKALGYLGLAYHQMGDMKQALPYFQQAYDLGIEDTDHTIPFFHLAKLLWTVQGSPQKAKRIIRHGTTIINTYAPPQKSLLLCQLWELAGDIALQAFGDLKEALNYYEKGLKEKPKNLSILTKKLAIVVDKQQDYATGEAVCQQILDRHKDNSTALHYQIIIQQNKG